MSDIPYSVRSSKPSIANLGGLTWNDLREEELIRKKDDTNAEGAGVKVRDSNPSTDTYIKSQEYFMTLPSDIITMGVIKQTKDTNGYVMKLAPLSTIPESNEAGLYLKYNSDESDNVRVSVNNTTADHEFSVGNSLKVDENKVAINNSGTLNEVDFEVNNTFFVNSTTRRVGINEVAPGYTFQVGDFFYVNQATQRVSIGTQPTDSYKLNVNGSLKNAGNLNLYNGLITAGETSNRIFVKDNADNEFFTLDHDNGRVGIGVVNPSEKLHVNGDITCNTLNYTTLNPPISTYGSSFMSVKKSGIETWTNNPYGGIEPANWTTVTQYPSGQKGVKTRWTCPANGHYLLMGQWIIADGNQALISADIRMSIFNSSGTILFDDRISWFEVSRTGGDDDDNNYHMMTFHYPLSVSANDYMTIRVVTTTNVSGSTSSIRNEGTAYTVVRMS